MARRIQVSRRSREQLTKNALQLSAAFLLCAVVASADEPLADSPNSAIVDRITSLFAVSYDQPGDEVFPDESELDPLAELESLLQAPVLVPGESPATLTVIDDDQLVSIGGGIPAISRYTPAAVTRIGYQDIWSSGSRNLDELFDIFVPNFQHVHQVATGPKLGMRGIISDRDDKFLLKVNGRIMNNRSQSGAFHERDLPLLGDLHHVDFLRGPGGATDGPGAIVGVINLQTHTGLTFQGFDATVRQGFVEKFTTTELRYGRKFDDDTGLFVYYGFANEDGASQGDAPLVFGRTFTARDNIPVTAGEPVTFNVPDDARSYRAKPKHKFHAQFTDGNFDAWVRYTRGGQQLNPDRRLVDGSAGPGNSFSDLQTGEAGYQQLTVAGKYLFELTEDLDLELLASWDSFDYERFQTQGGIATNREDEFYTRLLARWTPNERHSVAVGTAYSHEWFGLKSPGYPGLPANMFELTPDQQIPWETDTFSLMGEYVLKFNDCWTGFAGVRGDKHTYSDWLISPRAALVYTPNERDTYKFIWSIANRRATDADLRRQFLDTGTFSENEENESVEVRYERRPSDHLYFGASGFYQYYTAIGFNPPLGKQTVLGDFQIAGVELEATYRTDCTRVVASHSYTKLLNGFIDDPTRIQGITAEPYGFGSDLASWAPNLTKIYIERDLNELWNVSSSLRVYWGFPGDEDLANFNASLPDPNGFLPLADPGYKKAFRGSYFLDFGVQRKICCDQGILRLDLYNVLGWIDKDLNKRNVLRRAYYRSEAAALALSLRWEF
jgi:hypothetical protein